MDSWRNRMALILAVGGAAAVGVVYWTFVAFAVQLEPISPAARDAVIIAITTRTWMWSAGAAPAGYMGHGIANRARADALARSSESQRTKDNVDGVPTPAQLG